MSTKRQLATFTLDQFAFGIDVATVQEVLRYQPMTRVPLAPSIVGGLINLRGKIVAAIDLRRRLQLPARADGQQPMNVVLRAEEGAVSLLVDTIGEVVTVDSDDFEPPPDTMTGAAREVVEGVYKRPDGLLLALDWKRAVTSSAANHNGDVNNGKVTR